MILIKEILKKYSPVEILTILFFISVGISLIYKSGFYGTLGIGWYLVSLSPQQLFISSIVLIVAIFFGALIGYWLGGKLGSKKVEIFFLFMCFYMVSHAFIIPFLNINKRIPPEVNLLILTTMIVMFMVNENKLEFTRTINDKKINKLNFDEVSKYFFPLFFIGCLIGMPYALGIDAANLILKEKRKLNKVVLKDKSKNWLLIEINGDKVLLKKDSVKPIYKIIEYKDVEEIIVDSLN